MMFKKVLAKMQLFHVFAHSYAFMLPNVSGIRDCKTAEVFSCLPDRALF
jgi:hypothetical protein